MKKTILYIALLLTACFKASAQQDAQAKAILNQVSQKYKTYTSIKTDFTFTLDNPQAGDKSTTNGTLIVRPKQNKFKATMYAGGSKTAVEQEIISDGKTQWTYLKADKEVQVNNAGKADDALNPATIFTIYEHGYKYLYTGDQKVGGRVCQVIELSPIDASKNFFKVRLLIDKAKKQIYSAVIFDKGGAHYTYTLNTFTPNAPAADALFTWNKAAHPGVELVDLR